MPGIFDPFWGGGGILPNMGQDPNDPWNMAAAFDKQSFGGPGYNPPFQSLIPKPMIPKPPNPANQYAGGSAMDNTEFSSQSRMPPPNPYGQPHQGLLAKYFGPESTAGRVGGAIDSFGQTLSNPITQFGLALASGRTPQEGFGNAVHAQLAREKIAQSNLTGDIKEYQYAVSQGFKGSFAQWQQEQANIREQFGLNPVYYYDQEGKLRLGQASNRGNFKQMGIPGQEADKFKVIQTPTGALVIPQHQVPGAPVSAPAGPGGAAPTPGDQPQLSPTPQGPAGSQYIPKDLQAPARIKMDEQAVEPLAKQVAQSRATLSLLDQVTYLADKTPGGWAGPVAASVAKGFSALGIPVTEGMSNAELLTAATRQMIPSVREPGQTSNYEQNLYINAVPGIAQSVEGRQKIAELNKAVIKRKAEYVAVYRANVGSPDLDKKLAELDEKPMFTPEQTKYLETATGGKPKQGSQPQKGGPQTKIINGKTYQKIGDQWFEGM